MERNTEKMDVESFRSLLFVSAGLEPINAGERPTIVLKSSF